MESKEGCLGWGLRGVECVPVGRSYFRDGCARVFLFFWKRGHDDGDERGDRRGGARRGTLTGVEDLGMAQAEAKQPKQGDGGVRQVRTAMQIAQPVKALDR
jgi:hypothetical protein